MTKWRIHSTRTRLPARLAMALAVHKGSLVDPISALDQLGTSSYSYVGARLRSVSLGRSSLRSPSVPCTADGICLLDLCCCTATCLLFLSRIQEHHSASGRFLCPPVSGPNSNMSFFQLWEAFLETADVDCSGCITVSQAAALHAYCPWTHGKSSPLPRQK